MTTIKNPIQVAENLITKYREIFKQSKNFGACSMLSKNSKTKTIKEQVEWLKGYCERKQIELIID